MAEVRSNCSRTGVESKSNRSRACNHCLTATTDREAAASDEIMDRLRDVGGVHQVVVRVGVLAVAALQAHQETLQRRYAELQRHPAGSGVELS